jgi:hypothetical protein
VISHTSLCAAYVGYELNRLLHGFGMSVLLQKKLYHLQKGPLAVSRIMNRQTRMKEHTILSISGSRLRRLIFPRKGAEHITPRPAGSDPSGVSWRSIILVLETCGVNFILTIVS